MRARFVAKIAWATPNQASIEVLFASASPATKASPARALTFSPRDGKPERGRAIGLALAELLRELPGAAFTDPLPAVAAAPKADTGDGNRFGIGGMVAVERARSGNWATGPVLSYGFGLGPAWSLQAAGRVAFGSADNYLDFGFGLGARWDFLRGARGRLGIGLGGEMLRESAIADGEDAKTATHWTPALAGTVSGRLKLWRSLRLVAGLELRAVMRSLEVTAGEEERSRTTYGFSRWRPGFALGLELTL
jgi:hypothetical protein